MKKYVNRRTFMAAGTVLPLCACDWLQTDTAKWTEEVKLHDGRLIQLKREAARKSGGFPSADRGEVIYYSIEYPDMRLSWKGEWSRQPISFDIFDNTVHLAAFVMDGPGCANKAPTDFAAEFYKFKNGQWESVPQSAYPTSEALMNLYINFWGHTRKDDAHGLIPWNSLRLGDDFSPDHTLTIDSFFAKYQNFLCKYTTK